LRYVYNKTSQMKLDELENHEFLKTLLNDAIEISKENFRC